MNGLDCAKYQKSRKWTQWELLELLMRMRQKCNSVIFSILKTKKNDSGRERIAVAWVFIF